ncbi:uncharacterized protein LOC135487422 isoform X2 [Lineus longissimus]|uniref:uncharacterized protein LOC135487422 isoform X2 n=1 Tax=Lineus longissimus TaxID=88925 RepID=UPI002B4EA340
MNTVLTIFVVIASISLVLSSSIPQYGEDDDGSFLGVLDSYKTATKRQNRCRRWGESCDPRRKNGYFICCEKYYCKCSIWGSCRCTGTMFG